MEASEDGLSRLDVRPCTRRRWRPRMRCLPPSLLPSARKRQPPALVAARLRLGLRRAETGLRQSSDRCGFVFTTVFALVSFFSIIGTSVRIELFYVVFESGACVVSVSLSHLRPPSPLLLPSRSSSIEPRPRTRLEHGGWGGRGRGARKDRQNAQPGRARKDGKKENTTEKARHQEHIHRCGRRR